MTIITPWVATGKSEAMGAAASVLESLGRHQEAMTIARKRIDRYPDEISGRAEMAALLWRQDLPNDVPRLFQDPRQPPGGFDWSGAIGRSFQRSFAKRSVTDIEAAFIPLIQAGINPWYLVDMAKPMARSGRPDAAFAMLTAVTTRKPTGIGPLDPRFNAYRYLKTWKGEVAAADWVRSVVTPGFAFAALAASLDEGLIDVFWMIPDPPEGPGAPGVKLMRAVAVVLAPSRARQDAQSILGYFKTGKRTPQSDYASFLLGAKPTSEFLSLARDPARRGAVAYYLGIQAIGKGDYETASDWLEACVEMQTHSREFDSAQLIIRRWIESPRGFAEMRAEPFP
jgi:hypothetical protein